VFTAPDFTAHALSNHGWTKEGDCSKYHQDVTPLLFLQVTSFSSVVHPAVHFPDQMEQQKVPKKVRRKKIQLERPEKER
jgi:hypothetical protein